MSDNKKPRSRKLIKADIDAARKVVWKFEDELRNAKEWHKKHCKHDGKKKIVNQSSGIEPGRMSTPYYWRELVCRKCGSVIATEHTEENKRWTDNKGNEVKVDI